MKHSLYDYLKLGFDNPKKVAAVWLAILMVLSSLGYNVFNMMTFERPKVFPKQPTPSIITDIRKPITEEYPEVVTPTYKPHRHPLPDVITSEQVVTICKGLIDLHEGSDLH